MKKLVRKLKDTNKPLLFMTILYLIIGLVFIVSASSIISQLYFGNAFYYFINQSFFIILGTVASLILITCFKTKILSILGLKSDKASTFGIVFVIFIIIYIISKVAFNSNNDTFTINIGNRSVQVVEFIKLLTILFLSDAFYKWVNKEEHIKGDYLFPLLVASIPVIFIFIRGDKGSALVLALIVSIMVLFIPNVAKQKGFKIIKRLIVVFLILGFLVAIFAKYVLKYADDRIKDNYIVGRFMYADPCNSDSFKYQVCNGFIAIRNGGIKGLGIGESTQKYLYLPYSHTDFIFPIIVEETGVIFGSLIIVGYAIIAGIIFKISSQAYNFRGSLLCFGVGVFLLVHVFVNLGGALGLIPLTGIPLPLLSFGGTSVITMLISFSFVQMVNIETRERKSELKLKKAIGE